MRLQPLRHHLLVAAVAALFAPASACGQDIPARTLPAPPGKVCDASMRVVAIRVVDTAGTPVKDARVELRRAANGVVVANTGASSDRGDYVLFDDLSAPPTAKGGETFNLTVSAGSRRAAVTLVIGRREPDRCHVEVLKGDQRVVVR